MSAADDREELLHHMKAAADGLYFAAVGMEHAPLVALSGVVHEYVKACREMHERGEEFRYDPAPEMLGHHARHIAWKLDDALGPLMTPETRATFVRYFAERGSERGPVVHAHLHGEPLVHALWHGAALCGKPGPPGDWTGGDAWVRAHADEDRDHVTCPACREANKVEARGRA